MVIGMCIQQLCMSKMSKNGKSVEYLDMKDQAEKKQLVVYSGYNESEACWLLESELHNALEILNDYKVSHGLT